MKAFMIAGTASGCGKSTVAMGLNRLLSRKGYKVQPWKCGPDYIDPGFHSIAAGQACRNLDTRLMGTDRVEELFHYHTQNSDLSLVEGVMGYFDGDAGRFVEGSSYHLSTTLKLPVFVTLDVRSCAQSAGAMALGFQKYKSDAPIAGFILNRVGSVRHEAMVRDAVEEATGLPVVAVLPRRDELKLPERHLGLVLAGEQAQSGELDRILDALADLMEEHFDLDKLLALSEIPAPVAKKETLFLSSSERELRDKDTSKPIIGVARDDAFAFYYEDNLDMLRARGAELKFFSPIKDKKLPEGCSALYFGGGYPERFAKELSENCELKKEILDAAEKEMPIYGECGGYMYLAESLLTQDEKRYPMLGLLPGKIAMRKGLRALGYGDVTWQEDNFLGPKGTVVPGHLFHWSSHEEVPEDSTLFSMDKKGQILNEGYLRGSVMASYVHFHFVSEPRLVDNFIAAAATYEQKEELKNGKR